jgi:hypothetical protein
MAAPLGNQNGVKGTRWRDAIDRALSMRSRRDGIEALDALAEKLLALADQGDLGALKELGDRIDGKALQSIDMTARVHAPVELTDDQLAEIANARAQT